MYIHTRYFQCYVCFPSERVQCRMCFFRVYPNIYVSNARYLFWIPSLARNSVYFELIAFIYFCVVYSDALFRIYVLFQKSLQIANSVYRFYCSESFAMDVLNFKMRDYYWSEVLALSILADQEELRIFHFIFSFYFYSNFSCFILFYFYF